MPGTITPIVMPKWGLSMKEGTVTRWLVAEGDEIAVGNEIVEIETEKIRERARGDRRGPAPALGRGGG